MHPKTYVCLKKRERRKSRLSFWSLDIFFFFAKCTIFVIYKPNLRHSPFTRITFKILRRKIWLSDSLAWRCLAWMCQRSRAQWCAHPRFQTAVAAVRTKEGLISKATSVRNIIQCWQNGTSCTPPSPETMAPGTKDGWRGDRWCLRCGGENDRCRGAPQHGPLETEGPCWEQTAW